MNAKRCTENLLARTPRVPAFILAAALAVVPPGVSADIATVVTQDGQAMTFEYEGGKLRVNVPDGQGYMLVRDQHMYMVTENDGQPMVIDMNSAFNMFGGMAAKAAPELVESKVVSLKPTGRHETHGGMDGEVYLLRYVDHEGHEQEAEIVLSSDARALGFRDAIASMAKSVSAALRNSGAENQFDSEEQMQRELEKLNKGVLRYGEDMKIQSIEGTRVADARFVLPAEPTDLGAMLQGMGTTSDSDSGEGSGGILGGLFGQKADRQEDRVKQKTDDAVDDATDSAVDKALDKAFGKIFGN